MAEISSSPRLRLERAPALRRLADRLDAQAEKTASPSRARNLARKMRLRAAELECGDDHWQESSEQVSALLKIQHPW
jgi:hypothetical protein